MCPRASPEQNDFTFIGRQGYFYYPELELYFAGMGGGGLSGQPKPETNAGRMLDPLTGQWTSADPVRDDEQNLYRYVRNNPVNNTDPSGNFLFADSEASVNATKRWLQNELAIDPSAVISEQLSDGNHFVIVRNAEQQKVIGRSEQYENSTEGFEAKFYGALHATTSSWTHRVYESGGEFFMQGFSFPTDPADHAVMLFAGHQAGWDVEGLSRNFAEAAQSPWEKFWNAVSGFISGAVGAVKALGGKIIAGVKYAATLAFNEVLAAVNIAPETFWDAVKWLGEIGASLITNFGTIGNTLYTGLTHGFRDFGVNILTVIQESAITWLAQKLELPADIKIPEKLDLAGVGTFFLQVFDLTLDRLKGKLAGALKIDLGMFDSLVDSVDRIQELTDLFTKQGPVEAAKDLFRQAAEAAENFDLGTFLSNLIPDILKDLIPSAPQILIEAIIKMAFPAAGVIQWIVNGAKWIADNVGTIQQLMTTIQAGLQFLLAGDAKQLAAKVYEGLKSLLPPIMGLIATTPFLEKILALIKKGWNAVQSAIRKPVDALIAWLAKLIQPFVDAVKRLIGKITGKPQDEGTPENIEIAHEAADKLKEPEDTRDAPKDFESVLAAKKEKAKQIEKEYNERLQGQKLKLKFVFAPAHDTDGKIHFAVLVTPNFARIYDSLDAPSGRGIWDELGPGLRGEAIEKQLGQNLPQNFDVIDKFKGGVATSIKSMDLGAKTYQSVDNITRVGKGYIDTVSGFQGASRAGVTINASQISGRALELAVPPGATPAQQQALQNLVTYGQQKGVTVVIIPIK